MENKENPIFPFSESPQTDEDFAALMQPTHPPVSVSERAFTGINVPGRRQHYLGRTGIRRVELDYEGK